MGKSILRCYNLLDSRLSQQRSDTPLIWDSEDGKQQVCVRLNRKWLILILKGWCKTATVNQWNRLKLAQLHQQNIAPQHVLSVKTSQETFEKQDHVFIHCSASILAQIFTLHSWNYLVWSFKWRKTKQSRWCYSTYMQFTGVLIKYNLFRALIESLKSFAEGFL